MFLGLYTLEPSPAVGNGFPRRGTTNVYGNGPVNVDFFVYDEPTDEPLVDYVPYLAVFNDAEARERFTPSTWKGTNIGGNYPAKKLLKEQILQIQIRMAMD